MAQRDPDFRPRRPHLLGIGGVGMAALAELLQADGAQVSGSDQRPSATLERLRALGIDAVAPHGTEPPADADAIVFSSAIREENPELRAARERGLPILHRSQALALVARERRLIAVAGAHGKTTTSAMVTQILRAAGWDPTFAIGGEVIGLGTGARLGSGDVMVAEADESDGSFLNYTPEVAVVTNVEADHLDHFGTQEAFEAVFDEFCARIVPGGLLIACANDPGAARLAERYQAAGGRVWRYGTCRGVDVQVQMTPRNSGAHVALELTAPELTDDGAALRVGFELGLPGMHQALNAAAAYAAACAVGVDPLAAVGGLDAFTGTKRRFELRGTVEDVAVYDDYAHHPSEIEAMLAGARASAGKGRLIVLFQPHLFSRTQTFADRFARALSAADEVVVMDIYPAREDPIEGVTSQLITQKMTENMGSHVRYEPDREAAAARVAQVARPGDLIITVGAGDVTDQATAVLRELAMR